MFMDVDEVEGDEPMEIDYSDPTDLPNSQRPIASPYLNCRHVATTTEESFMEFENVVEQQTELRLENHREQAVLTEDHSVCCICLVNRPTRQCTPCGHVVLCISSALDIVTARSYSVLLADSSVQDTYTRPPVTCPICRAIIKSLQRV